MDHKEFTMDINISVPFLEDLPWISLAHMFSLRGQQNAV